MSALKVELAVLPTTVAPPSKPIDLNWVKVEAYFDARSLAENTRKAYRRAIKRFRDWCDLPWGSITPRIAAKYKAHLEEQGYKPSTINAYLSPLADLYQWMMRACPEQNLINPWSTIDYLPVPQPLPQDLGDEAMGRIWAVLADRSLRDRLIFALLAHGLRVGELVALKLGDYDGEKILVREAKADSTGVVYLSPATCAMVEQSMDDRSDDCPIVWRNDRGSPGGALSANGVRSIVRLVGDLAGVINLHPHQMRHTAATGMLRKGLTPEQVGTILRHKSLLSTRRYTEAIRQQSAGQAFLATVGEVVGRAEIAQLAPPEAYKP
jgi:integrase/recombinase XerD